LLSLFRFITRSPLLLCVDPRERRLGRPVENDRQKHDPQPRDQAHAQFEIADAAQDQHAQPRRRDERGDHHHRKAHHDGLVHARHDVGQRQRHLHAVKLLAVRHAEGVGRLDHVAVHHADAKIGQTDHRHDGVKDDGDAVELRLGHAEQEDQGDQVDEGRQRLKHVEDRDRRVLHPVRA
jgi:hypothetical protein